jgi:hypothetical protein
LKPASSAYRNTIILWLLAVSLGLGFLWTTCPLTLEIDSIYSDEGAYALTSDLYFGKNLIPYQQFEANYGPVYFFLTRPFVTTTPNLLALRQAGLFYYSLAMLLSFPLLANLLEGRRLRLTALAVVLAQSILGPQMASFIPYSDLMISPFLMLWLWAISAGDKPKANHVVLACCAITASIFMLFLKPQYGLFCGALSWLYYLPTLSNWRFLPLMATLYVIAQSHRFPALAASVLIGCTLFLRKTNSPLKSWREAALAFGAGSMLAAGLLLAVSWSAPNRVPLEQFPAAMQRRAQSFKARQDVNQSSSSQKWVFRLALLACLASLTAAKNSRRPAEITLVASFCLFSYHFLAPRFGPVLRSGDAGTLLYTATVLLVSLLIWSTLLCFIRLCLRLDPETPSSLELLAAMAITTFAIGSYDLSYLHARCLAVPLLFAVWTCRHKSTATGLILASALTVTLGLVTFNLCFWLDLSASVHSRSLVARSYQLLAPGRGEVYVTPKSHLDFQRINDLTRSAREVEVVDKPGLAFLLDKYTDFQIKNPQFYFLFDSFPNPATSRADSFIVPDFDYRCLEAARNSRPALERLGELTVFGQAGGRSSPP